MLFFRIYQHLLPRARAWNLVVEKQLRQLFEGLSEKPAEVREYIDLVYLDLFPDSTREIAAWEKHFGITAASTEQDRRDSLTAEWQAQGGQDKAYIQGILQSAGFDVYLHEWWSSGPPYVARDPRNYATSALIGTNQCADTPNNDVQCTDVLESPPRCNRFPVTEPDYLVNKTLGIYSPPPLPDDPTKWPFFIYVGAETFPNEATIPLSRKDELERLLLKLCPAQHWIVLLINYELDFGIFDDTFSAAFE